MAHLFGHSHGRLTTWNLSLDIGVDCPQWAKFNFAPVPAEAVLSALDVRENEMRAAGRIFSKNGAMLWRQDDIGFALRETAMQGDCQ